MPNASAPWIWLVSALALSALVTAASIRYAKRRKLIDEPGMRRSHSVPTPRGGGIGIVVAIIVCGFSYGAGSDRLETLFLVPPVIGIALVGWIDDHGGLAARTRFAMHCAAALWAFAAPALFVMLGAPFSDSQQWLFAAIEIGIVLAIVLAVVWSINLHNFMDGINGLLAFQAIFVWLVLAGLEIRPVPMFSWQLLFWAAAAAAFVPFNFPRARVFMGDVGSGVIGFLIAVAVVRQMSLSGIAALSGLVACSAFVTDATCTLLSRMGRRRRWYSAHREHLYQWLVRCGNSHARVVAFYMGWNLLIVLPVICWMNRSLIEAPGSAASTVVPSGIGAAAGVYALAVAVWLIGKRRCLTHVRARGLHAPA